MKGSHNIPKVSVIIPAYNMELYIDRCIQSICKQTFKEIEIIIVDDGSKDSTGLICKEWSKKDSRINYLYKNNEGQGIARNVGISLAQADYLVFIDADDWVNPCYIDKLYNQAISSKSDIVACDYIEYDADSDNEIRVNQNYVNEKGSLLVHISPTLPFKLWKKDIFIKNRIEQPSFFFEDIAIVPFLLANAKKISYADDSLYYYFRRKGSTTKNINSLDDRLKALDYLVDLFKSKGIFEKYKEELKEFVLQRCQADMSMTTLFLNDKYNQVYKEHDEFLNVNFQTNLSDLKKNEFVWGSYNLYRIAHYTGRVEITYRFMASSVISAVTPIISEVNKQMIERKILLRKENVIRDCTKRFMHMNPEEFKDVQIVLVDFLDERFPIAYEKGGYITLSDAYMEDAHVYIPQSVIEIENRGNLWYECCNDFIRQIENCFPTQSIILIRSKLSEYYGEKERECMFDNVGQIRKINCLLDEYYDYFKEKCRNVKEIVIENEKNFYTDKNFRHGCYPWHLNEDIYKEIGILVRKMIESEVKDV